MLETVIWIGLSQSLFAGIIIAAKPKAQVQDKILSAWLFLLAIEFLSCGIDFLFWGIPMLSSSFLLFNPAFYLYVKSLTTPDFKLQRLQLLHLTPFILFELSTYILKQKFTLNDFFLSDSNQWFRYTFSIASLISWIIYNYISISMVSKHRKKLENEFSSIQKDNNLKWLLFLIIIYNLYCGFSLICGIVLVSAPNSIPPHYVYNYSALLILIYIFGFYGLRQKRIFIPEKTNEISKEKYAKSVLTDSKKSEIKCRIISFVEDTEAYLKPELNMTWLSTQTGIPKHNITEVLSTEMNKNFFGFINEYRVKKVKELLMRKNYYSIEGIGYECGFSSKSSFFTVFKSITGMTPLEYKKSFYI